ncbi:hypothetical protein AGMMS50229_18720 [Campylobacterota bacterium]|nr:hypothetical protein AGMMS50229_18720 [Campylobacterota bacterium]
MPQDELDKAVIEADTQKLENEIASECEKIFANSATYSEALEALENLYPKMEFSELENALTKYLANSAILAAAEVEDKQRKQAKGGE